MSRLWRSLKQAATVQTLGGLFGDQLVRKHVPDSDPGSIPAPAGDTNHRRPNNDSPGSQERNVALGLVPSQKQASGQPVARFSSSYVAFTRPYVIPAEAGIHRRRGQRNHSSYSKSLRMLYRPAVHHIQVSVFYLITLSVSALRGRVRRTE